MHIKCWKEKESKAVDEAYRKTQQDREALFQRAVDGDETLEVPEWAKALLASLKMGTQMQKVDPKDIHIAFWASQGLMPRAKPITT